MDLTSKHRDSHWLFAALLGLGAAILLTGCAASGGSSPIRFAIEELGSEGTSRGDGLLTYRSATSITGVSQPVSVGGYVSVPGMNLPELLSTPVTASCSRIVETKYKSDATASDVRSLGAAIDTLQEILIRQAANNIESQLLRRLKARAAEVRGSGGKPNEDGQIKALTAALGLDTPPDEADLNTRTTTAATESEKVVKESREAHSKIATLSSKDNLIIARWSSKDSQSRSGSLGAFISGGQQSSEGRSGYLIMAGLRTATLELGADAASWLSRARETRDTQRGALEIFPDTHMTLFTLGAQHHYFVEDRDLAQSLQMALKLSASELGQIFGGDATAFIKAQSLALEYALATSVAASSRGMITSPERTAYPYRLGATFTASRSADAERTRNATYSILYSYRSDVRQMTSSVQEDWLAPYCAHRVPREGAIKDIDVTAVRYTFCLPKPNASSSEASCTSAMTRASLPAESGSQSPRQRTLSPLCEIPEESRCIDLESPIGTAPSSPK